MSLYLIHMTERPAEHIVARARSRYKNKDTPATLYIYSTRVKELRAWTLKPISALECEALGLTLLLTAPLKTKKPTRLVT